MKLLGILSIAEGLAGLHMCAHDEEVRRVPQVLQIVQFVSWGFICVGAALWSYEL